MDKAIQDLFIEWNRETEEQVRKECREAAAEKERQQFAAMRKMVGKPVTEEDIRDLLDLTKEQYDEYMSTVVI